MRRKKCFRFFTAFLILVMACILYKGNFLHIRQGITKLKSTDTFLFYELNSLLYGSSARIPVLMYHSVNDKPVGVAQLSVKNADFEAEIKYLAENGYTTLTFDQLKDAGKYKKPILITFDDGYIDNYTNAYPILKKYNCRATIFMVSDYINAPGFLKKDEIKKMTDQISFQSHTVSHRPMSDLNINELRQECAASEEVISEITKKPVIAISYPNGSYNQQVLSVVSQYYSYGVTTKYGYYTHSSDNNTIRRVAISRTTPLRDFIRLIYEK